MQYCTLLYCTIPDYSVVSPANFNLLHLRSELLYLLHDNVLGPHLRGQVCHTPGQSHHVALQPLESLVVVLILPSTPAFPLLPPPLVLVVVEVAAADAGDAGEAGHATVHLPPGYARLHVSIGRRPTELAETFR